MPTEKQTKGNSASIAQLRLRIARAPQKPGVYRWLDERGNVLYIGKAKNLQKRLKTYVVAHAKTNRSPGPWKEALLKHIADFDVTVTKNELEALMLETNLIKEHRPKYNVLMKDDKNYVYVKITMQLPYPSVDIIRRMEERDAKYFGPFTSGRSVKHALDLLQTVFNYRACKRSIDALNRNANANVTHAGACPRACRSAPPTGRDPEHPAQGKEFPGDAAAHSGPEGPSGPRTASSRACRRVKPCIESQIGRCNGLCDGKLPKVEYRQRIEEVVRFFKGDRSPVRAKLKRMMETAALNKKFEQAARLRDTLRYIQSLDEQQIVSGTTRENTDAIGAALRAGKSQVTVLQERSGKVINELSYALSGQAESSAEVLRRFLPQYYSDAADIPDTVLIGEDIEEQELLEELLHMQKGKPVSIQIPARGKKSKLLAMAQLNAAEKIERQFAAWEAAAQNIETALTELQETLALESKPKRIECYDISHLHGTETVGSMVVFVNGKPRSDHYRSFTIRTMRRGEIDDCRALREVLTRRLRYLTNTEEKWQERGIEFGKARKDEQRTLEDIVQEHPSDLNDPEIDYRRYVVARKGNEIIACGTLKEHKGNIRELTSVWVANPWRGQRLGHSIAHKILRSVKRGKVYLMVHPKLEQYYTELGFRYISSGPKLLEEDLKAFLKRHPGEEGILMMNEISKNKPDPSLCTQPDLLLLDGGKGQLGVGVEALKTMNLNIPVISLAKREEEMFTPSSPSPTPIPEQARFLLMRLRDEAHRFANRHRERRERRTRMQ